MLRYIIWQVVPRSSVVSASLNFKHSKKDVAMLWRWRHYGSSKYRSFLPHNV